MIKVIVGSLLALTLAACDAPSEVVQEVCLPGEPDYVAYVDGDAGLSAEWIKLSSGKAFANKAEYGSWHSINFASEGRVVPVCK